MAELETIYDSEPDYLSLYAASSRRLGDLIITTAFQTCFVYRTDSIPIKNNYANLLIDLGKLDEAQKLLDEILSVVPTYDDALTNKNRLQFLRSNKPSSADLSKAEDSSKFVDLGDPLLLAFADDEIERSAQRYKFKRKPTNNIILPSPDKAQTVQDFIKMAYQSCSSGNYEFAFKLCSESLHQIGPQALIYDCASDLYLSLKRFAEAELYLLHSVSLDGPSPKRMLNLSNLASMRGDIKLATKYLESAASLDPSHPHLARISEILSKKVSSPFDFSENISYPEIK